MAAPSAPTIFPDTVALWRHALEALPENRSPCPRMTPDRWATTRAACLDFIDRFGAEAHRLGWTAPELFGVHPQHGTLRLEMCGVMMVNGRKADGVGADHIVLGNQTGRRDKPGQVFGPPIWEFAAKGTGA